MSSLLSLYSRRAALLRELADLEVEFGRAFESARPEPLDAVLSLSEAAAFMGEPVSTFRRRPDYLRALVSRPTERRRRYSREALCRIRSVRLDANGLLADRS